MTIWLFTYLHQAFDIIIQWFNETLENIDSFSLFEYFYISDPIFSCYSILFRATLLYIHSYCHSIYLQIFMLHILSYVLDLALNKIILPHLHNILPYLWLYSTKSLSSICIKMALTFLRRMVQGSERGNKIPIVSYDIKTQIN